MSLPKISICIVLLACANTYAADDSPIDMAEMLDESTLAIKVIRDWYAVDGPCPTRQKYITICVGELWPGQDYRIPVRMIMQHDGDKWTVEIELKDAQSQKGQSQDHDRNRIRGKELPIVPSNRNWGRFTWVPQ